ncbi:MAG: helix-turn-helix domain-containing protein [Actinobacteria bacterium]|nr:helix-turn-helix domain-containing protein [Actinomycetota bacterium]
MLGLAEGMSTGDVARDRKTSPPTVRKWRNRYTRQGVEGLWDYPRSGRPPVVDRAASKSRDHDWVLR